MKINLDTPIKLDHNGSKAEKLGEVIKTSLFQSPAKSSRELYDKVSGAIEKGRATNRGKEKYTPVEVELTAPECSTIQEAVNTAYIAGVRWQVEDITNGKS